MALHKSTTVTILKKFNLPELEQLSAFIHFSVGDKNDTLKNAFAFLKSCAPDYDSEICSKENFSKKVFNKKLNDKLDKEINRLMSELKDEMEKYMACQYALKNNIFYYTGQMMWYHANGMAEQEGKILEAMKNDIINQNSLVDVRTLYSEYLTFNILHTQLAKDNVTSYFLWQHYLNVVKNKHEIELSIAAMGMENVRRIMSGRSDMQLAKKKVVPFYKTDLSREAALFKAQHLFFTNPDADTYIFLKEQLRNNDLLISNYDRINLLTFLIHNVYATATKFNVEEESLTIHEMSFEMNRSIRNGKSLYVNIYLYVVSLIANDKIALARKILHENESIIIGIQDKENFFAMVESLILEKEKRFDTALKIINNCHGEISVQKRDLLLTKVRLAYELNEPALLQAYLNNLRKYLSDSVTIKALPIPVQKYMMAFASYISKLFKLQHRNKEKLMLLKKKALQDKNLYKKGYVLEKIDEKLNAKN